MNLFLFAINLILVKKINVAHSTEDIVEDILGFTAMSGVRKHTIYTHKRPDHGKQINLIMLLCLLEEIMKQSHVRGQSENDHQ